MYFTLKRKADININRIQINFHKIKLHQYLLNVTGFGLPVKEIHFSITKYIE